MRKGCTPVRAALVVIVFPSEPAATVACTPSGRSSYCGSARGAPAPGSKGGAAVYWRWRRFNPLGILVIILGIVLLIAFLPWWFWFGIAGIALIAIGWFIIRGY